MRWRAALAILSLATAALPSVASAKLWYFISALPSAEGRLVTRNTGGVDGELFTSMDGVTPGAVPVSIEVTLEPHDGSPQTHLSYAGQFSYSATLAGPASWHDYSRYFESWEFVQNLDDQAFTLTDLATGLPLLQSGSAYAQLHGHHFRPLFLSETLSVAGVTSVIPGLPGDLHTAGLYSFSAHGAQGFPFLPGTSAPSLNFEFREFSFHSPFVFGVPEPMSWMMLVVGFGAVGATLRWRRAHRESGDTSLRKALT